MRWADDFKFGSSCSTSPLYRHIRLRSSAFFAAKSSSVIIFASRNCPSFMSCSTASGAGAADDVGATGAGNWVRETSFLMTSASGSRSDFTTLSITAVLPDMTMRISPNRTPDLVCTELIDRNGKSSLRCRRWPWNRTARAC